MFKRLEKIKDKNLTQLQGIKDQEEKQLKELKNIDESKALKATDEIRRKNDEANKLVPKFKKIERTLDKAELVCTKTDGTVYDYNRFAFPLKFIERNYDYEITLDEVIEGQAKLRILISKLNMTTLHGSQKKRALESARKLSNARNEIINLFEKGIFPYEDNTFKTKEKESEEESEKEIF